MKNCLIKFSLRKTLNITINVFNSHGKFIKNVIKGELLKGDYSVVWDGKNEQGVPEKDGYYYFKIKSADGRDSVNPLYLN